VEAWIETKGVERLRKRYQVASCVEAWIETSQKLGVTDTGAAVASCVEAWIETVLAVAAVVTYHNLVASCVEAWIET
jgi:hypothetical protein